MKTFCYVDAFNLYYGALKGTPYQWLNLEALFANLFPNNQIVRIKYFTARVNPLPSDPDKPLRQQLLFRALQTIPCLSIVEGHFLSHAKNLPLEKPPIIGKKFARVIVTEEKGSDVNLASHLLFDGFTGGFDCAIVVSGDSDLAAPIEMVRNHLKKPVGVLLPQLLSPIAKKNPRRSAKLKQVASFYRPGIRAGVLSASQFPSPLTDAQGQFVKPSSW
jgi:hypothetical protein